LRKFWFVDDWIRLLANKHVGHGVVRDIWPEDGQKNGRIERLRFSVHNAWVADRGDEKRLRDFCRIAANTHLSPFGPAIVGV
jgi:hypothetical protein